MFCRNYLFMIIHDTNAHKSRDDVRYTYRAIRNTFKDIHIWPLCSWACAMTYKFSKNCFFVIISFCGPGSGPGFSIYIIISLQMQETIYKEDDKIRYLPIKLPSLCKLIFPNTSWLKHAHLYLMFSIILSWQIYISCMSLAYW